MPTIPFPSFAWILDLQLSWGIVRSLMVRVPTVNQVTLDGPILTFENAHMGDAFTKAGFEVNSNGRRLLGVFRIIGLFNSMPAFEGWNGTARPRPRPPHTPSSPHFHRTGFGLLATTVRATLICMLVYTPRLRPAQLPSTHHQKSRPPLPQPPPSSNDAFRWAATTTTARPTICTRPSLP